VVKESSPAPDPARALTPASGGRYPADGKSPNFAGEHLFLNTKNLIGLLLLSAAALLIHGYHPYAEDSEIYLPGVLKILNPSLFPANTEFFGEHAGHILYPNLIAFSVRITHLPLPWVMLLWHLLSIFLLLLACWRLASALFGSESSEPESSENETAHWGAVALMAALLTLPIAGTFLYIFDQYLNPRNLAAFAVLFATAETLYRKYGRATLWLAFAVAMHPLMASFGVLFCAWLFLLEKFRPRTLGFAGGARSVPARPRRIDARNASLLQISPALALPFGITFEPPPPQYHQVALLQRSHFVLRWEWYEWLGVIGPVVLFWWLGGWSQRRGFKNLELISRAMVPFVLVAAAAAILLGIPDRFEALTRLQPLRCLALCYMVLIAAGGGLFGRYILQRQVWRWIVLFVPLSLGMYFAQRQVFPNSAHLEWPWAQPRNPWAQAFEWIRENTPIDALFALDPAHMQLPGEDENGFRARAERGMLADLVKDKGAASMFPTLSPLWAQQIADQKNWKQFGKEDFERLQQKYGVGWVVVEQPGPPAMTCQYENSAVRVCRLNWSLGNYRPL
jgi:hypothetical protein